MIVIGLFLFVFVPLHLATFKFGAALRVGERSSVRDLYRLVVEIFSRPGYVVFYVVGMIIGLSSLARHRERARRSASTHPLSRRVRAARLGDGRRHRRRVPDHSALDLLRGALMTLDSRPRRARWPTSGSATSSRSSSSTPPTSASSRSSSSEPAWPGASAAASLGELGYNVLCFCIHDSPRRAHSIAAQGGINAAKNYKNDGDSIYRLFYDTIKGGDYRAREANVYRLAQVSVNIIDQCVAQGVPFAREYGGLLDNRSFGGAQVSRTFYARGQTGQQLLLGAYQALMRQVDAGTVKLFPRREMLDLVVVDGKARGIIVRNLVTGEIESHAGHAVCSRPAATARPTTSRPTR